MQIFQRMIYKYLSFLFVFWLFVSGMTFMVSSVRAEKVNIAVAANFTASAKRLATDFNERTGYRAVLSFGSTGKLYAQIVNGAPFDVFLSADRRRPQQLEGLGYGVLFSRFTYAYGQIALWSRNAELLTDTNLDDEEIARLLTGNRVTRVAIANHKTAPYGVAALEYLSKLGVYNEIRKKLVYGENIAQTYQFAYTGNADLAIVAYTQVLDNPIGKGWLIPKEKHKHSPLVQDAILLKKGQSNKAAFAFIDYLKSRDAAVIMTKFGYALGSE
ncbi:molybdate ABC transporter substrate-binding protein [Kiloniella sp. EL199]|uniref:molybdate ABC transporter substrate-binding protein n=1 Tax=Kiloniella sp. EL199 TaxID=2107581 RepID=UPI001C1FF586|nr:molybdate ABC transporter substrate-binding protein [Kiloniella sp. EL199]